MAWYVVYVGHMPGIYRTWQDCHAQIHRYPSNCYKKYNTEAEALAPYNGVNIQNNNDQEVAMEIEEIPAALQIKEMSAPQIEEMPAAKMSFLGALLHGLRKLLCF